MGQRGVVLIVVLWIIVLLSFVVVSFVGRMQTETMITRNMWVDAEAAGCARSLVELAIGVLLRDDNEYDSTDDEWARLASREWNEKLAAAFPGYTTSLVVWDEGSRINLNGAGQYLLERLFENDASMAAAIMDWRDVDGNARALGAEDDYYRRLNPPYVCRDGLLDTKLELRQIRGGAKHYERIEDLVTTFGPLNPNLIGPDVFEALCRGVGMDGYLAERLARELPLLRGKGTQITDYDGLRNLPSMQTNLLEMLQGTLMFEGVYNVNMLSRDQLRLVLPDTGIDADAVDRIFRRSGTFQRIDDLISAMVAAGMDRGFADVARQYVTVRSSVFGIEARAAREGGREQRIVAIVQRYRAKPDDRNWQVEVLSWRLEPDVPADDEGGDEPSNRDE